MPGLAPEASGPAEERLLEERIDEKLRGNIAPFVSLFGQQPGQAADVSGHGAPGACFWPTADCWPAG